MINTLFPALFGLGGMSGLAAVGVGAVGALSIPGVAKTLMDPSTAWGKLTATPIKGDAVLVGIYGADLAVRSMDENGDVKRDKSANRKFMSWWAWLPGLQGKPDCYVKFRHGKVRGETQIEYNTFFPRFYETRKLKLDRDDGFEFQVWESDLVGKDRIVGRCWVPADKAMTAMTDKKACLLRLGAGIGTLKVSFTGPLAFEDRKRDLRGDYEKTTRQNIKLLQDGIHASDEADTYVDIQ